MRFLMILACLALWPAGAKAANPDICAQGAVKVMEVLESLGGAPTEDMTFNLTYRSSLNAASNIDASGAVIDDSAIADERAAFYSARIWPDQATGVLRFQTLECATGSSLCAFAHVALPQTVLASRAPWVLDHCGISPGT